MALTRFSVLRVTAILGIGLGQSGVGSVALRFRSLLNYT